MYKVTLHRVVEHETIYTVNANSEEEAKELVLSGIYEEIIEDSEEGEVEESQVFDIEEYGSNS